MAAPRRRPFHAQLIWFAAWVVATTLQLGTGLTFDATFVSPELLFFVVVVAATQCAVFSAIVLIRAFRSGSAETAMLGSFLMGVSVLPLAHGLLVPGVLYGPNHGAVLTAQLAVPIAGLAVIPLILPRLRLSSSLARRWRVLIPVHLGLVAGLAVSFLARPDAIPAPATGSPGAIAFAAVSLAICLAVSLRHLRLSLISNSSSALVLAAGLALVGAAPLLFVAGSLYSPAFWLAHGLDITGVLLAAVVAMSAYNRGATASEVLGPIEAATPLRALEVGLDPLVHRFVADLDQKDQITRDHVVRTARLAVAVADELGLDPIELRAVGLGAILHDVGKLEIPDEILKKPGRLTDTEFEVMRAHTTAGAEMVGASAVVADAAPFVRGHHERVDGRGYPDGLAGGAIPLGARIVAVCDAYDAMSHTRQYRQGMDPEKVVAILREHRGAQWDARAVDALLRVVERGDVADADGSLEHVGRGDVGPACCDDVVPAELIATR